MYTPSIFDPVNLFTSQSVAAATTSSPSSRLETSRMSKVQVTVKNTGASTNVTVKIYAVNTSTGGVGGVIRSFTLGAGSVGTPYERWCYIEKDAIPRLLYAVIENNDIANPATITVTVDRWR